MRERRLCQEQTRLSWGETLLNRGGEAVYVFSTELNLPMGEAIARVTGALAEEGLWTVSDINIQAIITMTLHEQFRPYRILGTCAPGLAKSLIGIDASVGALLPCNIVLQERDGRTQVSFMDPVTVLGVIKQPAIDDLARQVRGILEQVKMRLQS